MPKLITLFHKGRSSAFANFEFSMRQENYCFTFSAIGNEKLADIEFQGIYE